MHAYICTTTGNSSSRIVEQRRQEGGRFFEDSFLGATTSSEIKYRVRYGVAVPVLRAVDPQSSGIKYRVRCRVVVHEVHSAVYNCCPRLNKKCYRLTMAITNTRKKLHGHDTF